MAKTEGMKKEMRRQMRLALPLTVANFLMFAVQFVSVLTVSHLGHEKLAGASIAIAIVNSVAVSVLMGLSSALDTLCGQAFGAQNYKMVGLSLQRSMVIVTLAGIPLAFALAFSGSILILLGQIPEISKTAESYARLMIPSVFAFGLLQSVFKFLQAQRIVVPIMISSGITALLHCFFCWIFTFKTELGYRGSALSLSISYWLNLSLLALFIALSPSCKSTWTGFSMEAFRGLWSFLRLGIPSTLMVCFQYWQFELLLLLSGLLKNPELQTSVMSISQNIASLVYTIPEGISGAISTRISNELGDQNPRAAILAMLTATSTVLIEGLVVGAAMIGGKSEWGHVYSKETQVVRAVVAIMPWIALSHFLDGLQCVFLGIIRGRGRQKIGVFVCLGSYYLVGIPASTLLAFVFHKGVKGLWIGNICAIFVQDVLLLIMSMLTNWDKQVMEALKRIHPSEIPATQDLNK